MNNTAEDNSALAGTSTSADNGTADNGTADNGTTAVAPQSGVEENLEPVVAESAPAPEISSDASSAVANATDSSQASTPAVNTQAVNTQAVDAPSVAMQSAATPAINSASEAPTPAGGNASGRPGPSRQPSMAQIMEMDEFSSYISGADSLQRGALLKGIVVRVDENSGELLVDIGTKSEGIIARNEIGEDDDVKVGSEIEVVVLRSEDDEGHPVVSKRRADYERRWREIAEAKDQQTNLEGTVREQVKGGLIVDLGVPAFIPASHVDTRNRGDLMRFVGRTIPVRVIELDKKKNKVIASHRLAAEEDRKSREEEAWKTLQKDKIVEGVVRRITDFGAFIDLGGIDGLLHVREMAWGRVDHPENIVKKGQKLQVLILDIDEERKRVALGLKQLQSDPWKKAAKNYSVGQTITGKVVRIAPSCAFMELEDGVEGIIPISEMSETRINKPEDVISVGQEIEARIKQIQPNQRRITLSLRAAVVERERRETRTAVREVNERASSGGGSSGGSSGGSGEGISLGELFGQELRAARERGRERNEEKVRVRREAKQRAVQVADLEEDDVEDWEGDDEEVDLTDEATESTADDASADDASADDATNAASDEAASDEAASDEAASDEAASDEAASDDASSRESESSSDEGATGEATVQEER